MKLEIMAYPQEPEKIIASAAKLCYSPVGVDDIMKDMTLEEATEFVDKLANMGHMSPFEHVNFTFAVEGISRACSHQIVRHRLASYSQQSQRYVREDAFEYIMPKDIERNRLAKSAFECAMDHSQRVYDFIVDQLICTYGIEDGLWAGYTKIAEEEIGGKDIAPEFYTTFVNYLKENHKSKFNKFEKKAIENARYVFPNAAETKMVFTMNIRTLLHFLNVRACERAQDEVRDVAKAMLIKLQDVCPGIFKNAGPSCVNGKCKEGKMSCGVNVETIKEGLRNV